MEYKNKYLKIFEKEYESKFKDNRDDDEDDKENFINGKLSKFPTHQIIKQLKLDELLWDFDAVSLYSSAMWDEKSIYPRIETGKIFTEDMNDELVEIFNSGNFTQGSAILKIKYYSPRSLIVQHIPNKEKVIKNEGNGKRN